MGSTPRLSPFQGACPVVAPSWWEQALVLMPSHWVPGRGRRTMHIASGVGAGVGWVVKAGA